MSAMNDRLRELLTEGQAFGVVATLMSDGGPQASVVWVDADGDHLVFNTAEGRVKTDNLRRDGRVALTVFRPGAMYEQAMVRGRVVEMATEGADDHIDSLAMKYLGKETYPFRAPGEVRVVVRVELDRVSFMG